MTTKKTPKGKKPAKKTGQMPKEYRLDYGKSRPNRFASRMQGDTVAVVLDPDVAEYFDSSDSVNALLRSVISALSESAKSGG